MKLIQKDDQVLVFEENPAANPNRILFILPVLGVILSNLRDRIDFSAALTELIEIEAILCSVFLLFFLFRKVFPVKVKINKKTDTIATQNLTLFFLFTPQPQIIPLKKVKQIIYYPWSPESAWTRSSLVFVLDDESGITITLPDSIFFYRNYETIGKTIAEFIEIPFTM